MTVEDIETSHTREKCEIFDKYIFLCVNLDKDFEDDRNLYAILFQDYVLTFHNSYEHYIKSILRKVVKLQEFMNFKPEWVLYGILDEVIDFSLPVVSSMEIESDTIDDLVLVLCENEISDLLARIGNARKKVTILQRSLRPKHEILRMLIKRSSDRISTQCQIYMRNLQDYIIQMTQNLDQYSETLNRSHSNYLTQISIEQTQASNSMNEVMKKLTAVTIILLPLQLVSGIWGMNIALPGQKQNDFEDCIYFYVICFLMTVITILLWIVGKRYKWF